MADKLPMEDLLNQYPPGKGIVRERKKADWTRIPQSGPGRKTLEKMDSQVSLDVHGMLASEAGNAVQSAILRWWRKGIRRALIIHGKGKHSQGKAVLKPLVWNILEQHEKVADFGEARKNEGGAGATWLILTISRGK